MAADGPVPAEDDDDQDGDVRAVEVEPAEAGIRIDKLLSDRLDGLSRARVQALRRSRRPITVC